MTVPPVLFADDFSAAWDLWSRGGR